MFEGIGFAKDENTKIVLFRMSLNL